jgi:hypothetical protein
MNERHAVWPNLPRPLARKAATYVVADPDEIRHVPAPEDTKACRDYCHLPWLMHLPVGRPSAWCHMEWRHPTEAHSRCHYPRFEQSEVAMRYKLALRSRLAVHHGLSCTRAESGLLPRLPTVCIELSGYLKKALPAGGGPGYSAFTSHAR